LSSLKWMRSHIRHSPFVEALTSKRELSWRAEGDERIAEFNIDERWYTIVVRLDRLDRVHDFTFARIDFMFGNEVKATDLHTVQFKVLGIVKNGVIDEFLSKVDGLFFVAKRAADPEHYESRRSLYGRILSWARTEHSLIGRTLDETDETDETVFLLAKTDEVLKVMLGDL